LKKNKARHFQVYEPEQTKSLLTYDALHLLGESTKLGVIKVKEGKFENILLYFFTIKEVSLKNNYP